MNRNVCGKLAGNCVMKLKFYNLTVSLEKNSHGSEINGDSVVRLGIILLSFPRVRKQKKSQLCSGKILIRNSNSTTRKYCSVAFI